MVVAGVNYDLCTCNMLYSLIAFLAINRVAVTVAVPEIGRVVRR